MNSQQFLAARKDRKLAVLEGFHSLKHALRFQAQIVDCITYDKNELLELTDRLAPDLKITIKKLVREVGREEYDAAAPVPPRAGVISVARRVDYKETKVADTSKSVVWLDNPKDHENIGAIIRLSAGIGAGAVAVTGDVDPWNPGALRGSAGLHFACPVIKTDKDPQDFDKPVYVFDDAGESFEEMGLIQQSIIVFGSERAGVSEHIKARADKVVGIPMEKDVSSLNLATSVAIGLYSCTSN